MNDPSPSEQSPRRVLRVVAAAVLVLVGAAVLWLVLYGDGPQGPGSYGTAGPEGGVRVSWVRSVVVDSGGGLVGPWRMNRSVWRYVDDPTVASVAGGGWAVAWVDQGRRDVLFQRFDRSGEPVLPDPVNVSCTPEVFSWLPRAVVDGERVYLLWQEIVFSGGTHGGEAFFARSTDGGRTFSEPVNLSRTPAGAGKGRLTAELWHNGSLDLALAGGGTLVAAWTVYEGGLYVARSGDRGRSFSDPLRVTAGGGAEPDRGPSLAAGPDGDVHLAWAVGGDPAADLRYAVSRDGGRDFSEPRALFPGPGRADAPSLATAPRGTVHLAWSEAPGSSGAGHRIRYARAAPGAGQFGPARTAAAPGDGPLAAFRFPSIELDAEGRPVLVWELYREGADHPRGLGFLASGGATSGGGDPGFGAPGLVPGTADTAFAVNGSLQGYFMDKLAVDESGRVAVVNSAFEPGRESRVRLVLGRLR